MGANHFLIHNPQSGTRLHGNCKFTRSYNSVEKTNKCGGPDTLTKSQRLVRLLLSENLLSSS